MFHLSKTSRISSVFLASTFSVSTARASTAVPTATAAVGERPPSGPRWRGLTFAQSLADMQAFLERTAPVERRAAAAAEAPARKAARKAAAKRPKSASADAARAAVAAARARAAPPRRAPSVGQLADAFALVRSEAQFAQAAALVYVLAAALKPTHRPRMAHAVVGAAARLRAPWLALPLLRDRARARVFATPAQWQRLVAAYARVPPDARTDDVRASLAAAVRLSAGAAAVPSRDVRDAAVRVYAAWDDVAAMDAAAAAAVDADPSRPLAAAVRADMALAHRRAGDAARAAEALRGADSSDSAAAATVVAGVLLALDAGDVAAAASAVRRAFPSSSDGAAAAAALATAYDLLAADARAHVEPLLSALSAAGYEPALPSRASLRGRAFRLERRRARASSDHARMLATEH
jgi:hypothetical protein